MIKSHLIKELEVFIKTTDFNKITDTNLDDAILNFLKKKNIKSTDLLIKFFPPKDTIYKIEGGRSPYDILVEGEIKGVPFKIFLNNKLGNIGGNTRNDTTTYSNLLRLYLGIQTQRLTDDLVIKKNLILDRVDGKEIVAYAIFAVDKNSQKFNLFYLEEIADDFYVNPRNHMFQVSYSPNLKKEILDYYDFVTLLITSSIKGLKSLIKKAKSEVLALESIKQVLIELKNGGK